MCCDTLEEVIIARDRTAVRTSIESLLFLGARTSQLLSLTFAPPGNWELGPRNY
jgi:hypothetical protein